MPKNIEALFQISLNDLIFERLETSVSNPVCLEYGTSGKKDTRAPQMKKPIAQLFFESILFFSKAYFITTNNPTLFEKSGIDC